MAIVEMSKIRLLGLKEEKEKILNSLHKSGCVHICETEDIANTISIDNSNESSNVSQNYEHVLNAIDFFDAKLESSKKQHDIKDEAYLLKTFIVSYNDFIKVKDREEEILSIVDRYDYYSNTLAQNKTKRLQIENIKKEIKPYLGLKDKFLDYKNTKFTTSFLGSIRSENYKTLQERLSIYELACSKVLVNSTEPIILVTCFNDLVDEISQILSELSFSKCQFNLDLTAKEEMEKLNVELTQLDNSDKDIYEQIKKEFKNLKLLKIYADYLQFLIEKENCFNNSKFTDKTFIVEGFIPTEKKQELESQVKEITDCVYFEFYKPNKDEIVPTLTKNSKLIRQAEFITDMYSVPNYNEIDPNRVVFFFFMLFMGIIMADIGYGIIMVVLGLVLSSRIKIENGTKRLWNIIAISGISTVIFGILFNSFFGFSVLPFTIIPSPMNATTFRPEMVPIKILLMGSFGLGIIQIAVGYFLKAVNSFRQRQILDGIFEGLIWVVFFVGLVFASFNFLMSFFVGDSWQNVAFFEKVQMTGIIMAGSAVLIGALTAGRHVKGFGKFTKGFGAVYGLINLMSDILSYARLFGLMLSGMIISLTFNYKLGMPFIERGGVFVILGGLIILVGHIFNIAMNVLGAYIHDSRLQYIEFFSKFYTGEGVKFTPFGSKLNYIYLQK